MSVGSDLVDRLAADGRAVAVAIARISGGDVEVTVANGATSGSVFELGSLGKVLTATLLASLVVDGSVSLDTTLGQAFDLTHNRDISLLQLATHTSGLPRIPDNLHPLAAQTPQDPYCCYTAAYLLDALHAVRPEAGAPRRYSNFGFLALGEALGRLMGSTYDAQLRPRVLAPLGMSSTRPVTDEPVDASVPAHRDGRPVPWWRSPLRGAGGYAAPIEDLARFLESAVRGSWEAPADTGRLREAFALSWSRPGPAGLPLGWQPYGPDVVWHNGATGGSASFIGVHHAAGLGIAILTNHRDPDQVVTRYGLQALGGERPVAG